MCEKCLRNLVQSQRGLGGLDRELHRQAERAGQGGRLKDRESLRRHRVQGILHAALDLVGAEFPLVERHRGDARDRLARRFDLKYRRMPFWLFTSE